MMSKKKRTISFVVLLILMSIFSGIITYKLVIEKSSQKPIIKTGVEENKNIEKLNEKEDYSNEQWDFAVNDVFKETESLHIKSHVKPSGGVELSGKDKAIIIANFKALQKEKVDTTEIEKQAFDLQSYKYEIDIIANDIKIKFYDEIEYMLIEKMGNIEKRKIYKLEQEELKSFIALLEDIYINKVLEMILYPLPDKIYLSAKDENALYVLNKREMKDFASNIKILSIEDEQQYIGVPTVYPNYEISFTRDSEYKFYIKNDELMIINTPIAYFYCKYDNVLWDYIVDKLPQKNSSDENELKFLLKAQRVIVKDLDGVYDFENDSYYNIEIPRQILKSDLKEIGKVSNNAIDEDLRFVLRFLVNDMTKEVLVYSNYIVYGDNLYYSKNIQENIKSTLMVP